MNNSKYFYISGYHSNLKNITEKKKTQYFFYKLVTNHKQLTANILDIEVLGFKVLRTV